MDRQTHGSPRGTMTFLKSQSKEYRRFLTAISMISVTLQKMLNVAYSNCLNYSYYSDYRDEYFFLLTYRFKKTYSFLEMYIHTDV